MLIKRNNTDDISSDGIAIPYIVRFWLYLIFEIPSIICSIFVLAHLLLTRILRRALHNHMIILLLCFNLIVELTDIPWILHYYRSGTVTPPTYTFCMIWIFIDELFAVTTTVLFAWTTVEKHILIFRDRWLSTRIKVIVIHYVPIVFLSIYCLCYSIVVVIFPPCENVFDYTAVVCGYPLCSYDDPVVAFWDTVINHMIPTIIIILNSATLLGRILYQKKRLHQPLRWRKHQKMIIQLLSISTLYLILYIPGTTLDIIHLCGVPKATGANFALYAEYFSHYIYLLFPFVCAGSLPNLKVKIKKLFSCWRRQRRTIAPDVSNIARIMRGQISKESPAVRGYL